MEEASPPSALSGWRLQAAHAVWVVLLAVCLVGLVVLAPARMAQLRGIAEDNHAALLRLNLSDGFFVGYMASLDAAVMLIFSAVGLVIFWRRSSDPLGVLVSMGLIMNGVCLTRSDEAVAATPPPWQWLGIFLMVAGNSLGVTGLAMIPNVSYGFIVLSTVAKGRITAIDTREAEQAGGVIRVFTHLNAGKLGPPHTGLVAGEGCEVQGADFAGRLPAGGLVRCVRAQKRPKKPPPPNGPGSLRDQA